MDRLWIQPLRYAPIPAPGGRLALSGILDGQQEPLLARYGEWFDGLRVAVEGDWVRIDGIRRG